MLSHVNAPSSAPAKFRYMNEDFSIGRAREVMAERQRLRREASRNLDERHRSSVELRMALAESVALRREIAVLREEFVALLSPGHAKGAKKR